MKQVPLKNLTPRQRQAYILRFRRGWRLRRIAAEMEITVSSAGELVISREDVAQHIFVQMVRHVARGLPPDVLESLSDLVLRPRPCSRSRLRAVRDAVTNAG